MPFLESVGFTGHPARLDADLVDTGVVPAPDGGSSLEQWNHMLAWFESQNGPGQGGPGFGSRGNGTGHPGSPNGVRHGSDAGQPGGTPAFTIAVTEDMCAEIAACSGRQSKRGPVYVWDAPIDDLAETAVDIATDFIPGVAQAKTAYDAYQRIQNGEDTVDVLMAAGGDAVLGLIPGAKGAKKLGKALDKAEDVADAAGDVKGQVLKRDLTKGPHAPDTPIGKVIDRAQSTGKPQGRWTSTEAAERAAGRAREGQKTVPIAPGDGTVLHALPNGGVMIREATQAVTVPKHAGNKAVWHTYPVD